MAADLASTPRTRAGRPDLRDAHLANFGLFASPERRLVFDINDFDETMPGPWEWDIKRLATSLEVAGRDNGYSAKQRPSVVLAAVAAYRRAMAGFAEKTALEVWYAHADETAISARFGGKLFRKRVSRTMAKARTTDNLGALGRFAGGHDERDLRGATPPPGARRIRRALQHPATASSAATAPAAPGIACPPADHRTVRRRLVLDRLINEYESAA